MTATRKELTAVFFLAWTIVGAILFMSGCVQKEGPIHDDSDADSAYQLSSGYRIRRIPVGGNTSCYMLGGYSMSCVFEGCGK